MPASFYLSSTLVAAGITDPGYRLRWLHFNDPAPENFKKSIDTHSRFQLKTMLHSQNYEEKSTK
jgi:hypothetical protein